MVKVSMVIVLVILTVLISGIAFTVIKGNQLSVPLAENRSGDVNQIRSLCRNEQYQNIALQSLRYLDEKYSLITSKDLENMDPLMSYLDKTKELCKLLLSNNELQISEETSSIWNYRFIIKPFPGGVSMGYGLKFFENRWRFILPQSTRL